MNSDDDLNDPNRIDRFRPAAPQTQEEVGGVLERSFRRERGREPNEEESRRFLALADEAEKKAETSEASAREAEASAARAAERYSHGGDSSDTDDARRWEEAAAVYRREAESFRLEADRLRQYLA